MNRNRSIVRLSLLAFILSLSVASWGQVFISVRIGPPPLPVYAQPICPAPGYIWTPGYWAWNDDAGYYWVPGTWVMAPVGMLWTPGYWGWGGGLYMWHPGYWGPHVGFYGGINYGFGYNGVGYAGGEWRGRDFYYNRSVTNVSVTNVTNVYNKTVIVNDRTANNVSYNGGQGGVKAQPTPQQISYQHEQHTSALAAQIQQEHLASQNRENFASVNQGKPAVAATARAGDFGSHSAIPARSAGGQYHAPTMSPQQARGPSVMGNRPVTASNVNKTNRPIGDSTPSPLDRSSGGFRPFTPPNANNSSRATNNSNSAGHSNANGGFRSFTPPNANNTNRAVNNGNLNSRDNSNGGYRPFTPPNSGQHRASNLAQNGGRNNGNTSGRAWANSPRSNSRPQARQNARPQQRKASPPPPRKENPPREEPRNFR
jgi:hypothetical protein